MNATSRVRSRLGLVGGMMLAVAIVVTAVLALSGCAPLAASGQATDAPAKTGPADELRLGYFANVTHAPALVGLEEGLFVGALGDTKLTTQVFNAGPAAIEALSAGAIDATYIGPNPSINTFIQSEGASARIVAGAATGGAALVVHEAIDDAGDLEGTTLATPQLGNTQDVALRNWLADEGFETDTTGGGDVHITPTENAQTLTLFQQGGLDGAWLPEPWVSRLLADGGHGAHVLVDEADLWEDGAFPTTVMLVRAEFLAEHPETVRALLEGHVASVAWLDEHGAEAPSVINAALERDTGKALADAVITRALEHVTFSVDPHADAFETLVANGLEAGTQKDGSIDGLFDLRLLNELLAESASTGGTEPVSAGGLGEE
ncbi:MAG TPA: ABC transporter substrate-binding protein [Agromyces sp.]|nr:ABC transporter substrate-binding protein [Agromyces sp.]